MNASKQRLTREFWCRDEREVLVRKQRRWGWGWTIDFAEVARRLQRR